MKGSEWTLIQFIHGMDFFETGQNIGIFIFRKPGVSDPGERSLNALGKRKNPNHPLVPSTVVKKKNGESGKSHERPRIPSKTFLENNEMSEGRGRSLMASSGPNAKH